MIRFEIINPAVFTGIKQGNTHNNETTKTGNIQEVSTLPDMKVPVSVNIPSGYTKLDVKKLENGQEIHNYKLSNGLRVSILPMDTNFTMIKTFVNTGAINEDDNQRGISHFLEHMAFNGTLGADGYKKLSTGDVFRIVGNIGGDTNASTNFALTDYYIQAPIFYDNDLEEIISIQGAMMNNLALPDSMIEKERGPVISEINMYKDFPDSKAFNMAIKNLYNLDTTSEDYIAGSVDNIKNIKREDVLNYYRNNYYPANMYTALAGDVEPDEAIKLIAKHFHTKTEAPKHRIVNKLTPIETSVRRDFISPKIQESTGYIAFNGPANNNLKDTITLQFISALLTENSNSRLRKHFVNENIFADIALEKISTNPKDPQALYFEISTPDEKTEFALSTIYDELANFQKPSDEEVELIKKLMLSAYNRLIQTPDNLLALLGTLHFKSGDGSITEYSNIIKSITPDDIMRCVDKYLDLNKASLAIVHPQKSEKNQSPAFTGRKEKRVIKPKNLNIYNLANNYDAAGYTTNNNYRYINLEILSEKLPASKPGTAKLLSMMLNNGTANMTKDELTSVLSSNLINHYIQAGTNSITISVNADKNDMKLAIKLLKEQLLHPRLDEDSLNLAKKILKETLINSAPSAKKLIYNHVFQNSPIYSSDEDILKNIDNITLDDIKTLYNEIMTNGTGSVSFSTSKDEPEYTEQVLSVISTLPKVKNKTFKIEKIYTPEEKPVVLTSANNNAQASIKIGYKYKTNLNLRDEIIFNLLSKLLSKNAFNDLREKQQLAYSVNSYNTNCLGDTSFVFCNILTTTEDEETGEKFYNNIQKSIDGYQKLINDLKNGEFSDEELNAVKLEYKSSILSMTETDDDKLFTVGCDLNSPYGALRTNLEYSIIDTITKEEIVNAAKYIFNNNPIYAITATQSTLDNNTDYFKQLQQQN